MYAVGVSSDPGKRKQQNEDSIFAATGTLNTHASPVSFALCVIADGREAYTNGQDASCSAIQAIIDHILPGVTRNHTLRPNACSALLTKAVQNANEVVYQKNGEETHAY